MSKFAGQVHIHVQGEKTEYYEFLFVSDNPHVKDDLDEREILYYIEHSKKRKKMQNGTYTAFFIGEYEYEESYSWETGSTDVEIYFNITNLSITSVF